MRSWLNCWIWSETAIHLFLVLLRESLRHHGRPFELPTPALIPGLGVKRRHLRGMLCRLEQCGLVSIARRPSKPPLIRITPTL